MKHSEHTLKVTEIFHASLRTVDPYASVKFHTDKIRQSYQNGSFKKLIVLGFGKAAVPMAKAAEDDLKDIIEVGVVITKYGHCTHNYSNPPLPPLIKGGWGDFSKSMKRDIRCLMKMD
jgi:glycerate-2-kinase